MLACALVVDNGWRELRQDDQQVNELSDMLRSLDIHEDAARTIPKFRSSGSVSRKTTDLVTNRAGHHGGKTRCGRLDRLVIARFDERPDEMMTVAATLRQAYASGELQRAPKQPDEADDDGTTALEGRLLTRILLTRERSPGLRQAKIDQANRAGDPLCCAVCMFDFANFYGPVGEGYIEVHHVLPLHVAGLRETKLADLEFLCANCHRMCHRNYAGKGWRTPDALRSQMAQPARAAADEGAPTR